MRSPCSDCSNNYPGSACRGNFNENCPTYFREMVYQNIPSFLLALRLYQDLGTNLLSFPPPPQ